MKTGFPGVSLNLTPPTPTPSTRDTYLYLDRVAPNLYRHRVSGLYYGFRKIAGKRRCLSFKTADRKTAERKLAEWLRELGEVDAELALCGRDHRCLPLEDRWLVLRLHLGHRALLGGAEEGALEAAPADGADSLLRSRRPGCVTRMPASVSEGRLTQSMSRKANCDGNAMIESSWSTLKTESTGRYHFKTRAQAR